MSEPRPTPRFSKNEAERALEAGIFHSRWLIAPIYLGLIVALGALVLNFLREAWEELSHLFTLSIQETIMMCLSLIDASLVGNLLLIVIFSGYENFVSKIDTRDHEDRPDWMGSIDFGGVKTKLIGSIVAISTIALLRVFINLTEGGKVDRDVMFWLIALHLTFVLSGLLLAAMDLVGSFTRKRRL